MNLSEVAKKKKQLSRLEAAFSRYKQAKKNMEVLEATQKHHYNDLFNSSWSPTILLKKREGYNNPITVKVEISYSIVQQQLGDALRRARRELIKLGGDPD